MGALYLYYTRTQRERERERSKSGMIYTEEPKSVVLAMSDQSHDMGRNRAEMLDGIPWGYWTFAGCGVRKRGVLRMLG